ncbi:MAG: KpsF/GutQ family sugar-phosphate isomerase [Rickettsiales bacterium]
MYNRKNIITAAEKLVKSKVQALESLSDKLSDGFVDAVELILDCKGKVIVSGIGKSGHIANKIASTLSSISVPSVFLHPSEASHGDMGLITKQDVLVVLSNGGESQEIYDLLNYANENGNRIIAIVGNKNSTLYEKSDIKILIPNHGEGTSLKAPMISTSMMLTCGDAIAAAIISERHITNDEFKKTHPGGKIGASLLTVKDVMRQGEKIPVVTASVNMSEALLQMTKKSLGVTAVLEEGKLVGVISDGDIRRHMSHDLAQKKAEEVMSRSPTTITTDMLVVEALRVMNDKKITSLFIVDNTRALQGVIHMHDCIMLGIKQIDSEE